MAEHHAGRGAQTVDRLLRVAQERHVDQAEMSERVRRPGETYHFYQSDPGFPVGAIKNYAAFFKEAEESQCV